MTYGVIYFAYGKKYLDEAIFSASSLKKHNPGLQVTLFTNSSNGISDKEVFDNIIVPQENFHPFKMKIYAMLNSPYEQTLFLDTDTKIINDVTEPFFNLHTNDIAIAGMRWLNEDRTFKAFEKLSDELPGQHIYNTGVIYYKKSDAFTKFANLWYDRVAINGKAVLNVDCDQRQFNDLVHEFADKQTGLKIQLIPNIKYNCRLLMLPHLNPQQRKNISILHEHRLNTPVKLYLWKLKAIAKNILKGR